MSRLTIAIGPSTRETDAEVVAAVDRAIEAQARGEPIEPQRTLRFETWSVLFRTLTPNRIAILEYVAEHDEVRSVRALAEALGRDYSPVHNDVQEMVRLGLLVRDGRAIRCEDDLSSVEMAAG